MLIFSVQNLHTLKNDDSFSANFFILRCEKYSSQVYQSITSVKAAYEERALCEGCMSQYCALKEISIEEVSKAKTTFSPVLLLCE